MPPQDNDARSPKAAAYVHVSHAPRHTQYGYGKSSPGRANLGLCSKQIGQQFDCLALTLEVRRSAGMGRGIVLVGQ